MSWQSPFVKGALFPAPNPPSYNQNALGVFWIDHETPAMLFSPDKVFDEEKKVTRKDPRGLLIFSHGNACDMGLMAPALQRYATLWSVLILAFEYPGYGCAPGSPSEPSINAAASATYTFARTVLKIPASKIAFYGISIGTGVAAHMAAKCCTEQKNGALSFDRQPASGLSTSFDRQPVRGETISTSKKKCEIAGLILQSPFTSISDLAYKHGGTLGWLVVGNRWNTKEIISHVRSPILLLHGEDDTLIPCDHSRQLEAIASTPFKHAGPDVVTLVTFPKCGHNDLASKVLEDNIVKFLDTIFTKDSVVVDKTILATHLKRPPTLKEFASSFWSSSSKNEM